MNGPPVPQRDTYFRTAIGALLLFTVAIDYVLDMWHHPFLSADMVAVLTTVSLGLMGIGLRAAQTRTLQEVKKVTDPPQGPVVAAVVQAEAAIAAEKPPP